MKELSLDDILSIKDVTIEPVDVPEWNGRVYVRSISADKRDEFDMLFTGKNRDLVGVRARLVAMCLCTKDGSFVNPTEIQVKAIGKRSAGAIDRLFDACQRINGMREADVEVLEKNLRKAEGNGSG